MSKQHHFVGFQILNCCFAAAFSIFPLKSLFASVVSGPPRWDVVEYLSAVFQWSVKLDSE